MMRLSYRLFRLQQYDDLLFYFTNAGKILYDFIHFIRFINVHIMCDIFYCVQRISLSFMPHSIMFLDFSYSVVFSLRSLTIEILCCKSQIVDNIIAMNKGIGFMLCPKLETIKIVVSEEKSVAL